MSRNIMGLHVLVLPAEFPANTPERAAFKAHLVNVARALREIEHTEDGGPSRTPKPAQSARICRALRGSRP